MKKNDISFYNEDKTKKFNYRVALLATTNDKILLQKAAKDSYYSLIGGRVQMFESSIEAIIREVKEEIGIKLQSKDIKLINVVENFFTYNNVDFHELLFIYKTQSKKLLKKDNFYTLDKDDVINKWYNINDIDSMDIRPAFIKKNYNNDVLMSEIIK